MNVGQSFALWKNIVTFVPNIHSRPIMPRCAIICGPPLRAACGIAPDGISTAPSRDMRHRPAGRHTAHNMVYGKSILNQKLWKY